MRGLKKFNFEAFDAEAARLRAKGFEVVNPAEQFRKAGFDPEHPTEMTRQFLAISLAQRIIDMAPCDRIKRLPGSDHSQGATHEKMSADILGIPELTPEEEDLYGTPALDDQTATMLAEQSA